MAVMNMPEEIVVHRKQVIMRKEPIFFSVPLAGSEPASSKMARVRVLTSSRRKPEASLVAPINDRGSSNSNSSLAARQRQRHFSPAPTSLTTGEAQRLGQRQEQAAGAGRHRWDGGSQQRLGCHQRVGQAEGGLAKQCNDAVSDARSQAGADEAAGQPEGDGDEPGNLVGKRREGGGKGEGVGQHGRPQAQHGYSTQRQRGGDDAGNGGQEDGQQMPGLDRHARRRRHKPQRRAQADADGQLLEVGTPFDACNVEGRWRMQAWASVSINAASRKRVGQDSTSRRQPTAPRVKQPWRCSRHQRSPWGAAGVAEGCAAAATQSRLGWAAGSAGTAGFSGTKPRTALGLAIDTRRVTGRADTAPQGLATKWADIVAAIVAPRS